MSDLKREAAALGRVAEQLRTRHGWEVHLRAKTPMPFLPVTACGSREGAGLLGSTTDDLSAVTCARCLRHQAPPRANPEPVLDDGALYFTDNGAVYCGRHCGTSARFTGRDISGQKVAKVTADDAAQARRRGWGIKCETCGRVASAAAPKHTRGPARGTDAYYQAQVARRDLALAKKRGSIIVARTSVGNVLVNYDGYGEYQIARQATVENLAARGEPAPVIASGSAREVLPALAALYVVERGT